jgi:hypothetical protein
MNVALNSSNHIQSSWLETKLCRRTHGAYAGLAGVYGELLVFFLVQAFWVDGGLFVAYER